MSFDGDKDANEIIQLDQSSKKESRADGSENNEITIHPTNEYEYPSINHKEEE